jgi:hypothetical protein
LYQGFESLPLRHFQAPAVGLYENSRRRWPLNVFSKTAAIAILAFKSISAADAGAVISSLALQHPPDRLLASLSTDIE